MRDDALRRAILDLGLEDAIPLWEVADDCRSAGLVPLGIGGVERLGEALSALVRGNQIRILSGRWDEAEPRYVDLDEAETLLADARRYDSSEEIAHGLERV